MNKILKGVSKDEPIIENEKGGRQSEAKYAFHLIDRRAILKLAEVLAEGAKKYKRDNWRLIDAEEHYNHMIIHAIAALEGDTQDDHAGHMFCRAMMMYATLQDVQDIKLDKILKDVEVEKVKIEYDSEGVDDEYPWRLYLCKNNLTLSYFNNYETAVEHCKELNYELIEEKEKVGIEYSTLDDDDLKPWRLYNIKNNLTLRYFERRYHAVEYCKKYKFQLIEDEPETRDDKLKVKIEYIENCVWLLSEFKTGHKIDYFKTCESAMRFCDDNDMEYISEFAKDEVKNDIPRN